MAVLKRAHNELFRRGADQTFQTLAELAAHCGKQRELSQDRWIPPPQLKPRPGDGALMLELNGDGAFQLNDWSFTQLCHHARVSRDTVNRLSAATAAQVFQETLPQGNKPLQVFSQERSIRSIHGVSYTRLHNADILAVLQESATDFQPPQEAVNGGTGLYAGEQDMFVFLIDPTGWAEIQGQAFAPGFFVWNSEVGKRSFGVQTFWFQAVCQNHIVWDAVEMVEFTRKHTASIHDSLGDLRRIVETLAAKRDQRRDGFAKLMVKAMQARLGADAEEVMKTLIKHGISRNWASLALEAAQEQGRLTIFCLVDALTRMAGQLQFVGDRTEADRQAAKLLELVAA